MENDFTDGEFTVSGMSDDGFSTLERVRTLADAKRVLTKHAETLVRRSAEARELREKLREKQHTELRDYFAAAALTGMLANSHRCQFDHNSITPSIWAAESFNVADAMLAAREVRNE